MNSIILRVQKLIKYAIIKYERSKRMNIGNNIATLRKNKNLTQEELAKLINVSSKTISSYETNRSIPSIEILILLTKAMDTNIDTILNLSKENTEEIKNIYEKRNIKNTILKTIILSVILIIPLIYFVYSAYISISAFAAASYTGTLTIDEIAHNTLFLFLLYARMYLIYLIFMLVNYILYKKKCIKSLLILNGIFFLIVGSVFLNSLIQGLFFMDSLLCLVSNIIGLILGIKLFIAKKKIL